MVGQEAAVFVVDKHCQAQQHCRRIRKHASKHRASRRKSAEVTYLCDRDLRHKKESCGAWWRNFAILKDKWKFNDTRKILFAIHQPTAKTHKTKHFRCLKLIQITEDKLHVHEVNWYMYKIGKLIPYARSLWYMVTLLLNFFGTFICIFMQCLSLSFGLPFLPTDITPV